MSNSMLCEILNEIKEVRKDLEIIKKRMFEEEELEPELIEEVRERLSQKEEFIEVTPEELEE